jgi:hypothetical protein
MWRDVVIIQEIQGDLTWFERIGQWLGVQEVVGSNPASPNAFIQWNV